MDIYVAFYYILAILMILGSFIPLFMYLRYGREPEIDYNCEYEYDIPVDDPPAIVNAICGSGPSKKVGEPDINGFIATIMDLIDRNYVLIKDAPYEDLNSSDSLFLEINPDYDPDTLWDFEVDILNFLQEYEQDGIISMDLVSESLNYYDGADLFKYTYQNWENEVKQVLLDNGSLKEAFLMEGDRYIKIFGILGLISSIAVFFVALPDMVAIVYIACLFFMYTSFLKTKDFRMIIYGIVVLSGLSTYLFGVISSLLPVFKVLFISSIVLGVTSIVSLMLPQKIAGQWTEYGREYYTRWHSFKRYIQDYSLIKEYSPKSVHVWNRYLVYATALGIAEEVKNSMEFSIPYEQLKGSKLYTLHYYSDPVSVMKNAVETALDSN